MSKPCLSSAVMPLGLHRGVPGSTSPPCHQEVLLYPGVDYAGTRGSLCWKWGAKRCFHTGESRPFGFSFKMVLKLMLEGNGTALVFLDWLAVENIHTMQNLAVFLSGNF